MRDDDEDDEALEGEPFNAAAPDASPTPGLPPEPEAEPPEAERGAWPPSGLEPSPPAPGRSAGSIQMRDDDEDEPPEGEPFNAAAPAASPTPGLPPEPEAEPPEAERAAWPPSGLEPSPPEPGRSAGSIQMRDR
jgi:hypothetical protein